jgi:type IX secretion system PorP/SprF family membrane protein
MRKALYTVCALFCGIGGAMAQQQPQFSHYGFNGMYLSPAYAGITGSTEFTSIYRYQWAGYKGDFDKDGSPQTIMFTAAVPIKKLHGGLGLTLAEDALGPDINQSAQLSYSYHLNLGGGKLGIGVQGGVYRLGKDGRKYRPVDQGDPNIFQGAVWDTKFDMGAGLWYHSDKWYVGGGVTNLLESEYTFKKKDILSDTIRTGKAVLRKHGYLTAGVTIPVSVNVDITPTAIIKYAPEALSYEAGARATFNDKFWIGAGYRGQEAITGLAGVGLLKENSLKFGYAFDLTTFEKGAKGNTSHEVMLSYRIPASAFAPKPAIRTPRYSF